LIASGLMSVAGVAVARDGGTGAPPEVLRGAETQRDTLTSIDWMRVRLPLSARSLILQVLGKLFGVEPLSTSGRYRYRNGGAMFSEYAAVYWDERICECLVDVHGAGCNFLGRDTRSLLAELQALGGIVTRIDYAVDRKDGSWAHVIAAAWRSCQDGELMGARRYKLVDDRSGTKQAGFGLYVGARGNMGSGRYIRIYDKGLESKEAAFGQWVRWEVECTGDVARIAAAHILAGEPSECEERILQWCLGSIEFREANGRCERSRRPLVAWYSAVIEGVTTVRPVPARAPASASSWLQWAGVAVAPQVRKLADGLGISTDRLLEMIALSSGDGWSLAPAVVAELNHREDAEAFEPLEVQRGYRRVLRRGCFAAA
jgi:hypothetical protein